MKTERDFLTSSKITVRDIEERTKGHGGVHYLTVYTVMKGVTLANAAYTFTTFFSQGDMKLVLIPLWLASFAALILTYDATLVGLLILAWTPRWQDIVFPFALVVIEFLLFSTLQSEATIIYWFLTFAIFCLTASAIVWNVLSSAKPQNYEPSLSKLVASYRRSMKRDQRNSFILAAFWLMMFLFVLNLNVFKQWQWALGLIGLLQMIVAIHDQEHDRKTIVEQISQLSK